MLMPVVIEITNRSNQCMPWLTSSLSSETSIGCLLACPLQYNGLLCQSYQSFALSTFEMKIISLAGVSDIFTLRYHEVHALEILVTNLTAAM